MDVLIAIIYGAVQGITEFLPVSSSGHLVLLHNYLPLPINQEFAFDVVLHFATFVAVFWYFRLDLWKLLVGLSVGISRRSHNQSSKMVLFIFLATLPAALVGFFFGDYIEGVFRQPLVVAIMLVLVGLLFIWSEKIAKQIFDLENLTSGKSFWIGIAQAIALIPGTSRSGISVVAGLLVGLKRTAAIRFSFLISLPVIFGAFILRVGDLFNSTFSLVELNILLTAFLSATISGFFAIKFLLRFSQNNNLNVFAYYRFLLASLIIIQLLAF